MLSNEEAAFIKYWEANRLRHKKVFRQFLVGIPLGLLIVIPTMISLLSGWYKRAQMEANSANFNPMVLLVALLLIVGFTAIFYQRWKWDQYEQRYLELLAREKRQAQKAASASSAAVPDPANSNPPNSPNPSTPSNSNPPNSPNPSTPSNSIPPNSTTPTPPESANPNPSNPPIPPDSPDNP